MSIPSMDTLDPTLVLILNTLSKENGLKTWNLQPEFGGTLCVRIRFNGKDGGSPVAQMDGNLALQNSKTKHNFNRAQKWKLNQANGFVSQSTPQSTQQTNERATKNVTSIELPRNEPNSFSEKDHVRVLFDISAVDPAVIAFDQAEKSTTNSSSNQAETKASSALNHSHPTCDNSYFEVTADQKEKSCNSKITSLINQEEAKSSVSMVSGSDDLDNLSENDSFQECPSSPPSSDPYDNDNESVYSDDAPHMAEWPRFKGPSCKEPGCFYFPRSELSESEIEKAIKHSTLYGTFADYYQCNKCGRKLCDKCLWKRRHLNHMKHVKFIPIRGTPDPVNIHNLMNNIF